jgi:polysaccharide pyruvyl transferase WcaK-like protein
VALTMRFHATIFAQSQGVPAIGIDYFPGAGGKVTSLLAESGAADDVTTVAAFSATWLAERLLHKARATALPV